MSFITLALVLFIVSFGVLYFIRKGRKANGAEDILDNGGWLTDDDKFNLQKESDKQKLDRLLDKINQDGIDSLSKKEKAWLAEHSNENG